ncbi:hypothetical protein CYMTET_32009 [Cymbomonas tetramitiformis]|uniref:AAA+ ATPase domain-containing protein n=1 Tax=Cymbomonas tetramitiformis TaxID=36881 RepID=A0AAE0FFV4_9CHLO|nr:hypothetical protein CYMTET_32009 [Cymbomonas tetramitiformis]
MELVDDQLNVLQALGQRSPTRRDEALDALHRVFTVANAVAHVTAARRATAPSGHTVDDKVSFEAKHGQDIRILVGILLDAAVRCAAAGPEMRARLLCLLQCADRMLWTGVEPYAGEEDLSRAWQTQLRAIRKVCRVPRAPAEVPLGIATQELIMARLELRMHHLPRSRDLHKAVAAGADLAFGLVKSIFMMKVDEALVRGAKSAAGLALDVGYRALTARCFGELALQDDFSVLACGVPAEGMGEKAIETVGEEVDRWLRCLQVRHFQWGGVGAEGGGWKPTPGRWEPKAAFAALLADVAVGAEGAALHAHTLPPALLWRLCEGDSSRELLGLGDLMSLGVFAGTREHPPAMVRLSQWAQRLLQRPSSLAEWREEGFEILNEELRRVAERAQAELAGVSGRLFADGAHTAMALATFGEELSAPQTGHVALKPQSRRKREVEKLLEEYRQAIKALREVLRKMRAAVEAVVPAVTRVSKLLHVLAGSRAASLAPEARAAHLFGALRHMLLPCGVGAAAQGSGAGGSPASRSEGLREQMHAQLAAQLKAAFDAASWHDDLLQVARADGKVTSQGKVGGASRTWDELVAIVPRLGTAVAQVEDVLTKEARSWRKLECGAAVVTGVLVRPEEGKPGQSDAVPAAAGDALGKLHERYMEEKVQLRQHCDQIDALLQITGDTPRKGDAQGRGWREDLEDACLQCAAATGDAPEEAANGRGNVNEELEKATERIVTQLVNAILPPAMVEDGGLLFKLDAALEAVGESLSGSAAAGGEETRLAQFVGSAAAHADAGLVLLEELAVGARRCDKALERISRDIDRALQALSSTPQAPKRSILPLWAGSKGQPPAGQPTDLAQLVNELAGGLQLLEAALRETDPSASEARPSRSEHDPEELPRDRSRLLEHVRALRAGRSSEAAPVLSATEAQVVVPVLRLLRALEGLQGLSHMRLPPLGSADAEPSAAEELAERMEKGAAKGLAEVVQGTVNGMKVEAIELLESAAKRCGVEGVAKAVGEVCGVVESPALGLVGDVARWCGSGWGDEQVWRVREVAVLGAMRVIHGLQGGGNAKIVSSRAEAEEKRGGSEAEAEAEAERRKAMQEEAMKKSKDLHERQNVLESLRRRVMRCLAFEPEAAVRAVLARGEGLAAEMCLAAPAECTRGEDRGKQVEPEAPEVEARAQAAAREEQCAAWSATAADVEAEMEARMKKLAELRQKAEREPDTLCRQELLVRCREEQAVLVQASRNVKEVGSWLGVLVEFLAGIDTKLDAIGVQLDELQAGVRMLGEDLRRLVGRPVLEVLREKRERRAKQWAQLRDRVHIPIEGMKADENGEFALDKERSQAEDMLTLVTREFLQSKQKDVLLLSGPAGSGKSTFVRQLEHYLESVLAKEYVDVLLVMVSLPTLQNPVTDLFTEALRLKGLREAQIHELRDLVQAGEVRLVLLLDAYDELKPQFQFTNLYVSNSLEQFRRQDHAQDGKASPSSSWVGPKVIVTSRTELLMRDKQYANSFVPLEMDNEDKCDDNKAMGFFLELRIVSFENKLDAYMHAKVALEVRRAFQLRVGALAPVSEEAARGLFEAARKAFGVSGDSAECECVEATCLAVAVTGGDEVPPERMTQLNNGSKKLPTDGDGALPFYQMALVLATALKELPADLDMCLRAFAGEQAQLGQEERIWQHADYRRTFNVIPELQELTTTPFMVEIVTEILPQLDAMQSTDASIKAKLLLLLDERATQLTWRQICTWRSEHDVDRAGQPAAMRAPILQRVQEALDRPAEGERGEAELKALEELSIRVGDVLKEKKLVLEQPKLVAIARAQTKRWRGAMPDGRARRNVVGDGKDEAVDDVVEDVLEDLMIDAAAEEEICGRVVRYVLRIALCRTKVRGSDIYRMFVARYVEREARKAAAGGAHTTDSVRREGRQYAQRLALEMVSESVSKVPIASDSELFHEESIWDPFLRGEELLQAAQKAAPVLNDGTMLTFIHKTVQEYLCAAALRDSLHRVFHDLAVPLKRLQEDLIQSTAPADSMQLEQGHASEREQKGRGAGGPRSAQDVSAGVRVGPEGSAQEDAAVTEKALLRVEQRLLKSVWARVDLRREDVVRDFLVDMFLDEPELVAEVHLLVTWVERRCKGGRLQRGEACEGGMLPENVRAVLGGALPKRDGGTLLHAAASEGSYFAVTMALEMIDAILLEAVDADGRTPLFCAAQRGHTQVVAALRAAGAKHDARSKLQPSVRLLAALPFTKIPETYFGEAVRAAEPAVHLERGLVSIGGKECILEHGIIGAPAAAPIEGSWRYEVDVDLKWNDRAAIQFDAGADLSHANANDGWTPAHKAAAGGHVEALRVLPGRWFAAVERGMVEMVRELVDKGAEVDAEDGEGRTALTVALAFGQEAAARALLEAGAGANAGTGQRPLHTAVEKEMVEVLSVLVEKGAEVDEEDGEGRTALTLALAGRGR